MMGGRSTDERAGFRAMVLWIGVGLIGVLSCAGPSNPALRDRGERAYFRGDHEASIEAYAQVIERKPEDPEANLGLGKAYLALGDHQRARTHLTIAYHQNWLDDERPYEIAGYLAEAMAKAGDVDAVHAFLKERADLVGEPRDYIRWGDYARRFDDPDTAELAYRAAVRITGDGSVAAYLKLATLYEEIGKTDLAIRRLRQAYGIDSDHEEVVRRLGKYESVIGPTLALPPDDARSGN